MIKSLLLLSAILVVFITVSYFRTNSLKVVQSATSITPAVLGQMTVFGQTVQPLFEDDQKIIVKIGTIKIILSKRKDIGLQVQALQELLKQLKIDGHNIAIDLRFDKAVISNY